MNPDELKKLANQNKDEAIEQIFNRILLQKIVDITQRLVPPPDSTQTVEQVLARAVEAGDSEAQELVTDAGRESLRKGACEAIETLLAEDDGEVPD
jgi:hypothetical protein